MRCECVLCSVFHNNAPSPLRPPMATVRTNRAFFFISHYVFVFDYYVATCSDYAVDNSLWNCFNLKKRREERRRKKWSIGFYFTGGDSFFFFRFRRCAASLLFTCERLWPEHTDTAASVALRRCTQLIPFCHVRILHHPPSSSKYNHKRAVALRTPYTAHTHSHIYRHTQTAWNGRNDF